MKTLNSRKFKLSKKKQAKRLINCKNKSERQADRVKLSIKEKAALEYDINLLDN